MKSRSYNTFWQHLHKTAEEKSIPLRVMFELTYRCNFKCQHCYVPLSFRKKRELKTRQVFSILDQLRDLGCFYLGFTGGEPFMRKDIMKILWHARKCGFEIIINTNGSLINKKAAEELVHIRPNKIDITLPAMSKTNFELISGLKGSREKVFKAVGLLHKNGINLGFKSCVLKENNNEIDSIQNFAKSLGALHRLDDMLSSRLDGSSEPFKHREILLNANICESNQSRPSAHGWRDFAEADANLRECTRYENICVQSRLIRENQRLFNCGVGMTQAAITPLGELKMCVMIDYPKYKIINTSLKNCWERLKKLVKDIKPDSNYKCAECSLEAFCKWCPARSWLYNGSFTSCAPEIKNYLKAKI